MQEPEIRQEADAGEMGLLDYLEVIVKRKKLIFWITLSAFAASIIIAFILPKQYESTTMILPPRSDFGLMALIGQMGNMGDTSGIGGMANIASSLQGMETSADMYASILKSMAIKDAIIDRFKLMAVYDQKYRLDMYDKLDKLVDVTVGKKGGIISITVEDENPKRAADMANAYVEEMEKLTVGLRIYGAGQNGGFLEKRLALAKNDLRRSEEALKAFQARNKVFQVPDQAEATINGIAQLKAQLAAEEVQLSVLRSTFTDSSQEVKNALTSTENIRSQIARLENGKAPGAIPALGSVPELEQEYVRLTREFKTQETLVTLLTQQYEMTNLEEAKNISSVQVIQQACTPDKKVKPKRTKIVAIVTFFAFICSTGAAIAQDYYDKLPSDTRRRVISLVQVLFSWVPFKKLK